MGGHHLVYDHYKEDPELMDYLRGRNFSDREALIINNELYSKGDCVEIDGKSYKLQEFLAKGGLSVLWIVTSEDGEKYILKVFTIRGGGTLFDYMDENFDTHDMITHSDIQRFLAYDKERRIALLNYYDARPVASVLLEVAAPARAALVLLIADELYGMWEDGFKRGERLHKDVKGGNLLVDIGDDGALNAVKLTDPDLFKVYSDEAADQVRGTFPYMSPLTLTGKDDKTGFLHALGVTAHHLVNGKFFQISSEEIMSLQEQVASHISPPASPSYVVDHKKKFERYAKYGYSGRLITTSASRGRASWTLTKGIDAGVRRSWIACINHFEQIAKRLTAYQPDDRMMGRGEILNGFTKEELLELYAIGRSTFPLSR